MVEVGDVYLIESTTILHCYIKATVLSNFGLLVCMVPRVSCEAIPHNNDDNDNTTITTITNLFSLLSTDTSSYCYKDLHLYCVEP